MDMLKFTNLCNAVNTIQHQKPTIGFKLNDNVITLHGEIGDEFTGNTSEKLADVMRENPDKPFHFQIQSKGGSALEGIAMFNVINHHKGKTTGEILGVAGSAAGAMAMAIDELSIHDSARFQLHRTNIGFQGNYKDYEQLAATMKDIDESFLVPIYTNKTGLSVDAVNELLDGKPDGTILGAAKAKELGFVDKVIEKKSLKQNVEIEYITNMVVGSAVQKEFTNLDQLFAEYVDKREQQNNDKELLEQYEQSIKSVIEQEKKDDDLLEKCRQLVNV